MNPTTHSDGATGRRPPIPPLNCPVDYDYLVLPFASDRPRIWRFESGLVLDPLLRKLSRLSGAVDRSLALRLARLREGNRLLRLGYATFGDFTRERLNLNARTARELVRVGKTLGRWPALDEALRHGRITWSAASQLSRLAGKIGNGSDADASEDPGQKWVALAERLSVSALTESVKQELARRKGAGTDETARDDSSDGGGEKKSPEPPAAEDRDDPILRLRVATGARTSKLWAASLELCELVVGRPLGPGEGEEYILADFLSGTVPPPPGHEPCGPLGAPVVPSPERRPKRDVRRGPDRPTPAPELEDRRLSIDLSAEVAQALMIVDGPVPDDPFALEGSMRQLLAARSGIDLDLARMLRNFQSLNLARHLGFDNFGHYVAERLGISVDRARFLVTLDRRLTCLPAVADAVRQGRIGTVAALMVSRVARPGVSARAWVGRACARTLVRLREEVEWARRQEERLDWRWDGLPPPTGPLPSDLADLTAQVSPRAAGAATSHRSHEPWIPRTADASIDEAFADETGATSVPAPGDDGSGCEMSAGDPDEGLPVLVRLRLRESVVPSWIEARQRIGAAGGLQMVSDSRVLFEIAVAFLRTYMPLWIEMVETGDPIAVRDGLHCQMPGCTLRRGAGHHLRFRSRGGGDESTNLLFVCEIQHLDGIHGIGSIRVGGHAPHSLVVKMGLRPDGTALQTFVRRPAGCSGWPTAPEAVAV